MKERARREKKKEGIKGIEKEVGEEGRKTKAEKKG